MYTYMFTYIYIYVCIHICIYSSYARPMLSVHYAGPWYNEAMLRRPSAYWMFHKGALTMQHSQSLRPRARHFCKHLLPIGS